jgi:hypothetical protein
VELVTVCRSELEPIYLAQMSNLLKRVTRKWRLAFQRMQAYAFQQVSKTHILVFSKSFQHFYQRMLYANAGLHSGDFDHALPRIKSMHSKYLHASIAASTLPGRAQAL